MKKIVLSLFAVFLFSCGEEVVEKPKNLIPKEKMIVILHDLAILNSVKSSSSTLLAEHKIETMPFLFQKHQIDSTQFSQSDLYYASIPLEYQAIYEKVEEMLEERVKVLEDVSKRKKDSLANSRKKKADSISKSKEKKKTAPDA
ncbi:DUF4296 domain-containing protein [Flagellimonas eckloniae]|uniref:DUF4296 domain-containing protein n=1 Tax=Flagellimonas eckloniae TaxID=346185 RepID=A0A0Q1DPQ3_9FLAO|nr:DUF4296 domain-containing protein [Allomuricauda eckloniae]KQC30965.1 hypothetical protein AAY42_14480 [Allomuricauda eckloniae]